MYIKNIEKIMGYGWHYLLIVLVILVSSIPLIQGSSLKKPPFLHSHTVNTAVQILSQLTLEQKIGQLFMVAAVADEKASQRIIKRKRYRMDQEYIEMLIRDHHIGGIIFFGTSTPKKQKQITDHYQKISRIPLLVGQDLE